MQAKHLETPEELTKVLGRELSSQAVDPNGWTDLHHTALFNLVEPARALMTEGADVNAALKTDGKQLTADAVHLLYRLGLIFKTWEREGDTPLHMAACSDAAAAAKLLLDNGADLFAGLGGGGTPLNVAARFEAVDTASELLARGADSGARDAQGWTPLHSAAGGGALKTVRLLLDAGADVNAAAKQGLTPLHLSVSQRAPQAFDDPTITRLLLDWGAEVNALLDGLNITALDLAAALGRPVMANLLRRRGGDLTAEEKTEVVGMIDVNLGSGGLLMPIMKRSIRRRPPRNRGGTRNGGRTRRSRRR